MCHNKKNPSLLNDHWGRAYVGIWSTSLITRHLHRSGAKDRKQNPRQIQIVHEMGCHIPFTVSHFPILQILQTKCGKSLLSISWEDVYTEHMTNDSQRRCKHIMNQILINLLSMLCVINILKTTILNMSFIMIRVFFFCFPVISQND